MARIRTIKPEFFDDEDLAKLSYLARIAFVGLWTQADREGRLEDRPARLRVRLFPYEESVDMEAVLVELASHRFVQRYIAEGRSLLQVRTFRKHQRPHPKEPASELPGPETVNKNGEPRKETASRERPGTIPDTSGTSRVGREGDLGEREGSTPSAPATLELTKGQAQAAVQDLIAVWNHDIPTPLIAVRTELQPASRERVLRALRAKPNLSWWENRVVQLRASAFLTGRKAGRDGEYFTADFWWLLDHADQVESGRYDNREKARDTAAQDADRRRDAERRAGAQVIAISRGEA